jgi:hypothetical protein
LRHRTVPESRSGSRLLQFPRAVVQPSQYFSAFGIGLPPVSCNQTDSLTRRRRSSILDVVGLLHRLSAVLLCLGLIAGNAAICAGWAATPEERMACCSEGGECPMHKGKSHDSGSGRDLTQVEADACCAASEREHSSPSMPTFVAVLGPGIVLPASVPVLVQSDDWRTYSPIPTPPVPKHVLLSVFLV